MDFEILSDKKNYIIDDDPGPFSKNNGFLYNLERDGIFYKGFEVNDVNCNKAGIAHDRRQRDDDTQRGTVVTARLIYFCFIWGTSGC